jgi:hypothetical protein
VCDGRAFLKRLLRMLLGRNWIAAAAAGRRTTHALEQGADRRHQSTEHARILARADLKVPTYAKATVGKPGERNKLAAEKA